MDAERRKYTRFLAQKDAFAALRMEFTKVGVIKDISIKGLAFSYLIETFKDTKDFDSLRVDIFLSGNDFYLSNIPCKIVYDIPSNGYQKSNDFLMFRCGLQFETLKKNQLGQLEFFINNHTTGISPS